MYKSFDDRQSAGSSRSGGFDSPKQEESDLSDLGFLAAGAALLYLFHAISMASAVEGRKKRSEIGSGQIEAEVQDFLWTGGSGDQSKGVYGSDVQDFLWTGRNISNNSSSNPSWCGQNGRLKFLGPKYFSKVLPSYIQASKIQRTKTEKNQKSVKSFKNFHRKVSEDLLQ